MSTTTIVLAAPPPPTAVAVWPRNIPSWRHPGHCGWGVFRVCGRWAAGQRWRPRWWALSQTPMVLGHGGAALRLGSPGELPSHRGHRLSRARQHLMCCAAFPGRPGPPRLFPLCSPGSGWDPWGAESLLLGACSYSEVILPLADFGWAGG